MDHSMNIWAGIKRVGGGWSSEDEEDGEDSNDEEDWEDEEGDF